MGDLEVVVFGRCGRAVEEQQIVRERLAGPVVERPMFEARDDIGQGAAGGLQVTLHAHVELPLTRQARRVHDCAPNCFHRGLAARGFHVRLARSVTALAIDAFGYHRRESAFLGRRRVGVGIVAEHAIERDRTAEILLVRPVVAGAHRPVPAVFAVPADGHFDEMAARRAMQIAAGVVAGADHVIDPGLYGVRLLPVESRLVPALEPFAVALDHGVVAAGRAVIEPVVVPVVFNRGSRCGAVERTAHTGLAVAFCDLRMTCRAHGACYVSRLRRVRRGRGARTSGQPERKRRGACDNPEARGHSLDFH